MAVKVKAGGWRGLKMKVESKEPVVVLPQSAYEEFLGDLEDLRIIAERKEESSISLAALKRKLTGRR